MLRLAYVNPGSGVTPELRPNWPGRYWPFCWAEIGNAMPRMIASDTPSINRLRIAAAMSVFSFSAPHEKRMPAQDSVQLLTKSRAATKLVATRWKTNLRRMVDSQSIALGQISGTRVASNPKTRNTTFVPRVDANANKAGTAGRSTNRVPGAPGKLPCLLRSLD